MEGGVGGKESPAFAWTYPQKQTHKQAYRQTQRHTDTNTVVPFWPRTAINGWTNQLALSNLSSLCKYHVYYMLAHFTMSCSCVHRRLMKPFRRSQHQIVEPMIYFSTFHHGFFLGDFVGVTSAACATAPYDGVTKLTPAASDVVLYAHCTLDLSPQRHVHFQQQCRVESCRCCPWLQCLHRFE